MKKCYLYACLMVVFLYRGTLSAQQWYRYNPTAGFDINAVDILKPGYIALGGGKENFDSVQIMFTSPDYGITWNENSHDGIASWNKSIAFADTANGLGVGYQGRIIKTNDGGFNWGNAVMPVNRNLNKIVHATGQVYYVVGGREKNDSLQTILKTTNGGTNWTTLYDTAGPWLKSVYFITAQKGYAVGDSGVILGTTNGGTAWTPVAAPVQRNFNAITFINADTGYIAGGSSAAITRRTILRTVDGGANWSLLVDTPGAPLNDISFADLNTGYIVGDYAAVLKTLDGGQTWANYQVSNNLTGTETFRSVKFYDVNFGVVGGKNGVLFMYTGWPVEVVTLHAEVIDSNTADVFAAVNPHGLPGAVTFTYSTDSTFAISHTTAVQNISTNIFFPASAHLPGLSPNTWYYYFASTGTTSGDTLRFFTGTDYPVFKTTPGDVIDSASVRFKGEIHGLNPVTNIKFAYGSTPALGSVIAATPAAVNDTTDYAISALVSSLPPFALYYYRLRGDVAGNTRFGDIYFTGSLFHRLETLPAFLMGDTAVSLNGVVQGFAGPVTLNFEYGPVQGPLTENVGVNYPNADTFRYASHTLFSLMPNSLYQYRLKVVSGIGTRYGKTLAFYTGGKDSVIRTLSAQNATPTSAMLMGMVNHLPAGTAISFEYGPDSSMANSISAGLLADTLFHYISGLLTGVPVDKMYYYRAKAVTSTGAEIYGNIRTVYIGANEIPNWDFQLWSWRNYNMPTGWNIATENFNRVPGHSGNYALNLTGVNVALMGYPVKDDSGNGVKFLGGVPFAARPDSISFYIKGSLAPGDAANLIVILRKGNTIVAKNNTLLPVDNANVFERVTLPIDYQSSLMPDSLVLGITSVNPQQAAAGNQNNTITVDDFTFIPATAPIYNGDLESWFDYLLETPDSWFSPVFMGVDSNNRSATPVISRVIHSLPYDYAAEVRNVTLSGIGLVGGNLGVKGGVFYGDQSPAFPVHNRYNALTGWYKAYPVNGDSLMMNITLYNQDSAIGYGAMAIVDSVTEFTRFEMLIGYNAPNLVPDSADIEIMPHANGEILPFGPSRLIIDQLHFDGFTDIGDNRIPAQHFDENGLKIYPNPSNNLMTLEIAEAQNTESVIQIYGLNSQKQQELKMRAGESKASFSVAEMEPGFYLLRWINGTAAVTKKIVVIK